MKTWMTTIGQKPIAAVNTLWAVLREERIGTIGRVIVFYSEDMKDNHLIFTTWMEHLFSELGESQPKLRAIPFPTDDIKTFRKLLKEKISEADSKILMDMTSGRKAISALMLLIGSLYPGKVEKVYYSYLADADYMNFPYPTIPLGTTELYDMTEQ